MSDTSRTDSPGQIEREVEGTRATLETTIEALKEKASVGQMANEMSRYVRAGDIRTFAENLAMDVRDNPVPAVLIGVGVAWMAWSGNSATERRAREKYWRSRALELERESFLKVSGDRGRSEQRSHAGSRGDFPTYAGSGGTGATGTSGSGSQTSSFGGTSGASSGTGTGSSTGAYGTGAGPISSTSPGAGAGTAASSTGSTGTVSGSGSSSSTGGGAASSTGGTTGFSGTSGSGGGSTGSGSGLGGTAESGSGASSGSSKGISGTAGRGKSSGTSKES